MIYILTKKIQDQKYKGRGDIFSADVSIEKLKSVNLLIDMKTFASRWARSG